MKKQIQKKESQNLEIKNTKTKKKIDDKFLDLIKMLLLSVFFVLLGVIVGGLIIIFA